MKNSQIRFLHPTSVVFLTFFLTSNAAADETIIKQEKLSFEKCLKVIATSEDKLSIAPEVEEVSAQKRVAVFTLLDGTLKIICDGEEQNVTVSTSSK